MAERKTLLLRLSPQMYDDLSRWAEDEFRSVNGQIEYILREALVRSGRARRAQGDCEEDAGEERVPRK